MTHHQADAEGYHRLSISITREQYQALCTIARRRHTSLSQVIREALNNLEQS